MIKLLGMPLSNYYNMVKVALVEKKIEFEEVSSPPSQEEEYLAKSPMGKVPCLEVDAQYLTESIPILEYLEDISNEVPLLPVDKFARAKVRELSQAIELNLELVARRGIGAAFGREVKDEVKKELSRGIPKGCAAIARLTKFSPWIAGDQFTYADFVGYYSFGLASNLAKANVDIDIFELIPGSADWYAKVGEMESVKTVDGQAKR